MKNNLVPKLNLPPNLSTYQTAPVSLLNGEPGLSFQWSHVMEVEISAQKASGT